jgi:hypothetical protein
MQMTVNHVSTINRINRIQIFRLKIMFIMSNNWTEDYSLTQMRPAVVIISHSSVV